MACYKEPTYDTRSAASGFPSLYLEKESEIFPKAIGLLDWARRFPGHEGHVD